MNKAMTTLFNVIYNDGKLAKLVTSESKISKLDKYYKKIRVIS